MALTSFIPFQWRRGGSGKNLAANEIAEDSLTKQLLRVVLNDADGTYVNAASAGGGETPADTATLSNVASSDSNGTLLAANLDRRGATIVNDSTQILYVKFGATASATSYTYKLIAGATLEFPAPIYQGIVDGIWVAANGAARVTEIE